MQVLDKIHTVFARNTNFLLRPFLTRKCFREILRLEGLKISREKKGFLRGNFVENFPRPKFPQEKKARILPAKEISEPKISWRRGNFTRKFLDHSIIELKSVQDEAYPFPVLDDAYCCTYTHDCVLCCTHTCIESHKRCSKSLDERAWQDYCITRWNDDRLFLFSVRARHVGDG